MNLLQNFHLAVIEYLYLIGLLTNNSMFENQLHAACAQLALVTLNKQQ